ncbi:hypothetical protein HYT18_04610 [Candidatus Microgenomates bacterium]|nr:hypothetical protein [Candidatus Microgenomates bacterium]
MEIENTNQQQVPIQNPIQNQSTPLTSQSNLSKKIVIILAIIVALSAFGVGGYFLGANKNQTIPQPQQAVAPSIVTQPSPTNTPNSAEDSTTSTWKTYQDSKYGFSFRYPSNAQISTGTVASMLSRQEDNGINIKPPYEAPYDKWWTMDLVVRDNPQGTDAQMIINNYIEELKKTCSPPACGTPTMIQNTLKSYQNGVVNGYIFHIGAETDSAMVVLTRGNKTYVFRMSGDQGYVTDSGLKIFDQILSTFKFTN